MTKLQELRPAGQLDPYHYDPDPEEIARIDALEEESARISAANREPVKLSPVQPAVTDDPSHPWEQPGWKDPCDWGA